MKLAGIGEGMLKATGDKERSGGEWHSWWHKRANHTISGLGNNREKVKGTRMIQIAYCSENGSTEIANIKSEEVGDGSTFLFGLDLQRAMNIWADTINGQVYWKCTERDEKGFAIPGEKIDVPVETAQCKGSGLLMFRVDSWLEAYNYFMSRKRIIEKAAPTVEQREAYGNGTDFKYRICNNRLRDMKSMQQGYHHMNYTWVEGMTDKVAFEDSDDEDLASEDVGFVAKDAGTQTDESSEQDFSARFL